MRRLARNPASTLDSLRRPGGATATPDDALRHRIDDAALAPGVVHRALVEVPFAAGGTTNKFDTLLERGPSGWQPVVRDADVDALGARTVPLIYVDGHLQQPTSWIPAGSLADAQTSRRRLVALAERMLAAHPTLLLGYALDDPDLADLLALLPHAEAGLAPRLLVVAEEPLPSARVALEARGVWVAVARVGGAVAAMTVLPELLASAGDVDPKEVARAVEAGVTFEARLNLAEEYLHRRRPRGGDGRVWLGCLRPALDRNQWLEAGRIHAADFFPDDSVARGRTAAGGVPPAPRPRRRLQVLPDERFHAPSALVWRLDEALLAAVPTGGLDYSLLARWLWLAVECGIPRPDADLPVVLDLVAWCARKAHAAADVRGYSTRERAASFVADALARAERYKLEAAAAHIRADAEALGLRRSEQGGREGHLGPSGIASQTLRAALAAYLEGRFEQALDAYERVSRTAAEPFAAWIGCKGALAALGDAFADKWDSEECQQRQRALERRRHGLEEEEVVRTWLADAGERRTEAEREEREQRDDADAARSFGTRTKRLNARAYDLWMSCRDLEDYGAPPNLQRDYCSPLLRLGVLDPPDELARRLCLGEKGTGRWLRQIASGGRGTVGERLETADALRCVVLADHRAAESLRLVDAIPELGVFLRSEDVPVLAARLEDWQKRWPRIATLPGGEQWTRLPGKYARAWCALAEALPDAKLFDAVGRFVGEAQLHRDPRELGRLLAALPWQAWRAAPVDAERLVTFV